MNAIPDHPPPLPICEMCQTWSATFRATEQHEHSRRTLEVCSHCLSIRALLWERFTIDVHVKPLDRSSRGR